jgi:PilZ domain
MEPQRTKPSRRRDPRVIVANLVYIDFGPGNGGMILNISEGGLGFSAAVPVQKNGCVHFRLSEPDLLLEADAEVAWSDETHKRGGLRFINLSADARRHIHNWMKQLVPVGVDPRFRSTVHARESSSESAVAAEVSVGPPSNFASSKDQLRFRLQGFSYGLAMGLLLSVLIGGVFLVNSHRRKFGEVLVHWGEKLRGGPPQTISVESRIPEPPEQSVPSAPTLPQSEQATHPVAPGSQPVPAIVKREPAKREFNAKFSAPIRPSAGPAGDGDKATLNPDAISPMLPESFATPGRNAFADVHALLAPKPGPPSSINKSRLEASLEAARAPIPERYLEVGKFKEKKPAEETKEQVTQLGLPTILVQRRRLWMNSYYVLVGPYGEDRQIEDVRKELVSRGFQSRPYEKGSRNMTFRSGLTLNGAAIPCELCTVSWEAYEPNAAVKFESNRSGSMQAEGKLVRRDVWYERNAYVYLVNPSGSLSVLEIRLGSTNEALVFDGQF